MQVTKSVVLAKWRFYRLSRLAAAAARDARTAAMTSTAALMPKVAR
jgi:hypothetical protein